MATNEWNETKLTVELSFELLDTLKISSRIVQYFTRYQYANMEHTIQMYSAVEVRRVIQFYTVLNHGTTMIHEKLYAVYDRLVHCGPYTAHNFLWISVTLWFCPVYNRITLRTSTALYVWIACSILACWCLTMYCIIRLEIFTVYPATQNLVLPLIWFHFVHSWTSMNIGKLASETTLVDFEILGKNWIGRTRTCHTFARGAGRVCTLVC